MPKKGYKVITIDEDVYRELEKIKREKNISYNQLLKDLLHGTVQREDHSTVQRDISDLKDKICEATKMDRSLYLVDCNGKKAIVPFNSLKLLSDRFGLIIRLKEH
jgi:predicted CopG family antitoxin